jgi:antitoxin component YwqK of YwqJK toxin-antitoxin module
LWIRWFINGVKKEEKIYNHGKPADGLWTYWLQSGQKWYEETYKDRKIISKKVYK